MKKLRPFYVLAAILILPGCAVERKCESGGCTDDAKITARVHASLNRHPDLGPPDSLQVQTLDHVVYLNGYVSTGLMKRTAEDIARQIPGVIRVEDNIAVSK